jgi:hypothetical protein
LVLTYKKMQALKDVERFAPKNANTPMEFAMALSLLEAQAPGSIPEVIKLVGLERRTLYYHLDVARTLGHLSVSSQRFAAIGWTKLSIVAQHLKTIGEPKHRDARALEAIAYAEEYRAHQLAAVLKGKLPRGKVHSIMLHLNAKQYKVFEAALLKHKAARSKSGRGMQGKEEALTDALRKLLLAPTMIEL